MVRFHAKDLVSPPHVFLSDLVAGWTGHDPRRSSDVLVTAVEVLGRGRASEQVSGAYEQQVHIFSPLAESEYPEQCPQPEHENHRTADSQDGKFDTGDRLFHVCLPVETR